MAPFARAELGQIGRKMACNEYFGASLGNKCFGVFKSKDSDEFLSRVNKLLAFQAPR